MSETSFDKINTKNYENSFDCFARQTILKHRVAIAIATLKTKPDDILIEQHIDILRNKMADTEYDSDMTVCSDDFQLDDENVEVVTGTQDSDGSVNILEGFNLEQFGRHGDLKAAQSVIDDGKIEKIKDQSNEVDTQIKQLKNQSQNLLEEYEMTQSDLTFPSDERIRGDEMEDVMDVIVNDNLDITKYDSQETELLNLRDYLILFNRRGTQHQKLTDCTLFKDAGSSPPQTDVLVTANSSTQPDEDLDYEFGDYSDSDQKQIFDDAKDVKYESKDTQTLDNADEDIDGVDMDATQEDLPFKVMEELNRVRGFLNKRKGDLVVECASDSGYRSDSQKWSYKGSGIEQEKWLNQSAKCLVDFLTSCTMVTRSMNIINETSLVLGRLIDRLHAEEKYPAFIEETLEVIQKLLGDVYGCDGYALDAIHEIDDKINRLLLLNTSHHVIKYTIEKIVRVLEKFHSLLNEEALLEVTNIKEMEGVFHVLHALEVLLRRYYVTKGGIGTSQPSQDEGLTRSSIADIWRRKWDKRDDVQPVVVRSAERSVEVRCTEVLNRLVVDAMSRYSLLSFAALQCFNLLKT